MKRCRLSLRLLRATRTPSARVSSRDLTSLLFRSVPRTPSTTVGDRPTSWRRTTWFLQGGREPRPQRDRDMERLQGLNVYLDLAQPKITPTIFLDTKGRKTKVFFEENPFGSGGRFEPDPLCVVHRRRLRRRKTIYKSGAYCF